MTCRQAIAVTPALEADKQLFPWVQPRDQPLSADEPSVLSGCSEPARQKSGLAAFRQCRWPLADGSNGGSEVNRRDRKALVF
jgi:hypothetical protein